MEQGSEPLLFDGETHTPLLPARPRCPEATRQKPSCFSGAKSSPNPPQSAAAWKYSQVPGSPPPLRFLSGAKKQPGEGAETLHAHPSLRVGRRPHLRQPRDAPELGRGAEGFAPHPHQQPPAFCKTRALRGSRAGGCLSCASPGDRTGCPPPGRVLSGWLSGNSTSGKACGRTCGRRRCGR